MIRTSRMGNTTNFIGQIVYEKPSTPVQEINYTLLVKPKLIKYAESKGIDVPERATKAEIYVLIENKESEEDSE